MVRRHRKESVCRMDVQEGRADWLCRLAACREGCVIYEYDGTERSFKRNAVAG